MRRRLEKAIVGAAATTAALLTLGGMAGADVHEPGEDLPDGTSSSPAAHTPASTTSVLSTLENHDVDAFYVCVEDPGAFHLQVGGVDDAGSPRHLDTVVWLFDSAGTLVAVNDQADPASGLGRDGSELVPGAAASSSPGLHVVAVAHFRSYPIDDNGVRMNDPGSGPLTSWAARMGSNPGLYRADLLAGASGSLGCGQAGGPGVLTGNGRCQELGGGGAENGKAHGLSKNADKRRSPGC